MGLCLVIVIQYTLIQYIYLSIVYLSVYILYYVWFNEESLQDSQVVRLVSLKVGKCLEHTCILHIVIRCMSKMFSIYYIWMAESSSQTKSMKAIQCSLCKLLTAGWNSVLSYTVFLCRFGAFLRSDHKFSKLLVQPFPSSSHMCT